MSTSPPDPQTLLAELPPTAQGASGWPWTEASEPLPPARPDGSPWPRISLVTPSYNQARFIEATLRSVLLQGYPNLEFIVVDGGSTDGSVEIIRRYAPWLTHWESERDRGQAHALNKGFARASGPIYNWLCSDDMLLPGTLARVAAHYREGIRLIVGSTRVVDADRNPLHVVEPDVTVPVRDLATDVTLPQPSSFICGQRPAVREDMYYVMDWELFFRTLRECRPDQVLEIGEVWAEAVAHEDAKAAGGGEPRMALQTIRTRLELTASLPIAERWLTRLRLHRKLDQWEFYHGQAAGRAGLGELLSLSLRRPALWTTRGYLGALRRAVTGG